MAQTGPTLYVTFLLLSYPVYIVYVILSNDLRVFALPPGKSLLGLLCYTWIFRNIVYPFFFSPLRHLPMPPGANAVLGHGIQLFSPPVPPTISNWIRTVPNDGLIYVRGIFHQTQLLLATTPEVLSEVLLKNPYDYEKPGPARRFLARVVGQGLIVVEGREHKVQRKSVAAAFQGKHIRELVPIFWHKATHLADVILQATLPPSDGKGARRATLEVGSLASRCTLDIIGAAGFGRDFNTLENREDELARQYEIILDPNKGLLVLYFAINMLLPPWMVSLIPWKMNQRITAATNSVRSLSKQMVKERKEAMNEKSGQQKVDILSVLIKSGALPDDRLVDEAITFLSAGHETTSSAFTWATYLLSRHPDYQTRLRKELRDSALPSPTDKAVTIDADLIDSLPLLQAICTEVLRLYPTVPITVRKAIRPTRILNQHVPTGTEVMISMDAINRLPSLWGNDADEFRPERWLESSTGGAESNLAFATFIHGPRSCIGQEFARKELKCMLAAVVLRFTMELADPDTIPEPAGAITAKPKHGLKVIFAEIAKS